MDGDPTTSVEPPYRPVCTVVTGMLCDQEVVASQVATLEAIADVRVVILDFLTVGDAVAQICRSCPDQFALVGFSLGGVVALATAAAAPARVTHLGLIAATARGPRDEQRELWLSWRRLMAEGRFDRAVYEATSMMLPDGAMGSFWDFGHAMAERVGRETFDRQLQLQASRTSLVAALPSVRATTTVIGGSHDPLVPVARQSEIHGGIDGSELHVLKGAGHLLPVERPSVVSELLAELLAKRPYGGIVPAGPDRIRVPD